ncbi:MAG: hypothetical protein AUG49_11325 [Catenulispora sp. 13_1_20CM_3_70_7]|nr:MAG: hypothetical protein AUG49_11325 [Catenulispora sp. 13_1_20CM_3_70_7]
MRKPLALSALLASSAVGTVLNGADARATTYGNAGLPNPVTVTTADGTVHEVDGAGAQIGSFHVFGRHVAWSGQGGRIAYLDNWAIYTADSDGSHAIRVANVPVGIEIPALTWDPSGRFIVWSQGLGGNEQLMYAAADGADLASGVRTLVDQATMAKAGVHSIDALDFAGDAAVRGVSPRSRPRTARLSRTRSRRSRRTAIGSSRSPVTSCTWRPGTRARTRGIRRCR